LLNASSPAWIPLPVSSQEHCHLTSAGTYQSQAGPLSPNLCRYMSVPVRISSSHGLLQTIKRPPYVLFVQPNLPVPNMKEAENGSSGKVIEIFRIYLNRLISNRSKLRADFI
jgi:hypothetical protein